MRSITVALCVTILSLTCTHAQQVSSRKPSGLVLSTGNLYFTSHDAAGAAVWRTSQTSVPGQEGVLYWEQGAKFGDIVFAQVNGVFFGYFFAQKAGVIRIKRVPLSSISTDAILAPPRAWTQCGSSTCQLSVDLLTGNGSTPINSDALGVFVRSSGSNVFMFWGDAGGVHRKQF